MVSFASYPGTDKSDMAQGTGLADRADLKAQFQTWLMTPSKPYCAISNTAESLRGRWADVPEIPIEAIREAIVNAVTHRDYSPLPRGTK